MLTISQQRRDKSFQIEKNNKIDFLKFDLKGNCIFISSAIVKISIQ